MNKTAEQLHHDFEGKLVKIKRTNGEKIIGTILLAAGLEKAWHLVPGSSFIQVDAILNIEAYKRNAQNLEHELLTIHPDEIESIREYDLLNLPVHLSYADYQNIVSEANPLYASEIISEMEDGIVYIVIHEGVKYKVVNENDQLGLEPM